MAPCATTLDEAGTKQQSACTDLHRFWRAEWHLSTGEQRKPVDLSNAYSFDAINQLYNECSMREAGIQEFLAEGGIIPLNIFCEDLIQNYEGTIRMILGYLELDSRSVTIAPPALSN